MCLTLHWVGHFFVSKYYSNKKMLPEKIKTLDGYIFTLSDDKAFYTDGDLSWSLSEVIFHDSSNGLLGSDCIPFVGTTGCDCGNCGGFGWLIRSTFFKSQVDSTIFCGTKFVQCDGK